MLPVYTLEIARDEVADTWSQLAYIGYEDLSPKVQSAVDVLELEGHHRHSFIRSCAWHYTQLNEDKQVLIDAVVEEDYKFLIEESSRE